jgi:DNA-directed RNA polymerase beta' subunit
MASGVVASEVSGLWMGFYTMEEIRKLSVKKITNPISLDTLGVPVRDGLYDPALGPLEPHDVCETCGLIYEHCPGHIGHIELAVPVYQPVLFGIMYKILNSICFNCHRFRQRQQDLNVFIQKIHLLNQGELRKAMEISGSIKGGLLPGNEEETMETEFSYAEIGSTASLHTNIHEYRKQVVSEFYKSFNSKICPNCKAYVLIIHSQFIFNFFPS